jgi:Putative serine esterase (DUF676)
MVQAKMKSMDQAPLSEEPLPTMEAECCTVHLVVLVPGLLAPPNAMENTLVVLRELAAEENKKLHPSSTVLVYCSASNLGKKSKDGVFVCGTRLAAEVNLVIQRIAANRCKDTRVNLSLVGNSMGGIIARAALSNIVWSLPLPAGNHHKLSVVPKVFCSTNAPHLGCKDAVHVKLSRGVQYFFEHFLVATLDRSGKDLMRHNKDIETLATDDKYVRPLREFEKRLAFANSFRTDFRVATGTAAFLSPDSDSVHQIIPSYTDNFPFAVHAVSTKRQEQPRAEVSPEMPSCENPWMRDHCEQLDSMGWIKVFCDVRSELPSVKLPFSRARHSAPQDISTESQAGYCTSAQLHQKFCHDDPVTRGKWFAPFAHQVLTANETKKIGGQSLAKRGMPFVKEFAIRIMHDVLADSGSTS